MSHGSEPQEIKGLPANARRPLDLGEEYVPLVPQDGVPEVTPRAITMGLIFCAIFSMAAAYLALKLGQGIEAAIPNPSWLWASAASSPARIRFSKTSSSSPLAPTAATW